MSTLKVDNITDAAGTGAPDFTNGVTYPLSGLSKADADTGNGLGSTDNRIRRFTNSSSTGTAITVADTAANGTTFTINENGVYSIAYTEVFAGNSYFTISINSANLTTNASALPVGERFGLESTPGSSYGSTLTQVLTLSAGDVVRAHVEGTPVNNGSVQIIIRQLIKLS